MTFHGQFRYNLYFKIINKLFKKEKDNLKDTIDYVKPRLEAGLVSINITTPILENVPFGGVKESGYGLEGGEMGLHTFLNSKLIHKARP